MMTSYIVVSIKRFLLSLLSENFKSVNQSEKLVEFIKGRKNTGKTLGKCIKLNVLVLKNKFPYLKKEGRKTKKLL